MYHDLLRILVIEYKVVDLQYFMDEMRSYELQLFQTYAPWAYKHEYEQMRLIMYNNTTLNAKKGTYGRNIYDFYPLYTDKDYDKQYTRLSKDQLTLAREMISSAFKNKKKKLNKN